MSECQYVHIVVQDPSLVVCASHECLGLLLRADIESLVVDAFGGVIDHSILLTLCLKYTLVQIDVLHTHSLTIDYHIPWNAFRRTVYHILLISQKIHLESESHELPDAISVVFVLENGSR